MTDFKKCLVRIMRMIMELQNMEANIVTKKTDVKLVIITELLAESGGLVVFPMRTRELIKSVTNKNQTNKGETNQREKLISK